MKFGWQWRWGGETQNIVSSKVLYVFFPLNIYQTRSNRLIFPCSSFTWNKITHEQRGLVIFVNDKWEFSHTFFPRSVLPDSFSSQHLHFTGSASSANNSLYCVKPTYSSSRGEKKKKKKVSDVRFRNFVSNFQHSPVLYTHKCFGLVVTSWILYFITVFVAMLTVTWHCLEAAVYSLYHKHLFSFWAPLTLRCLLSFVSPLSDTVVRGDNDAKFQSSQFSPFNWSKQLLKNIEDTC